MTEGTNKHCCTKQEHTTSIDIALLSNDANVIGRVHVSEQGVTAFRNTTWHCNAWLQDYSDAEGRHACLVGSIMSMRKELTLASR